MQRNAKLKALHCIEVQIGRFMFESRQCRQQLSPGSFVVFLSPSK